MLALPGFHPTEILFESERVTVFRARRSGDERAVVVKALTGEVPTARDVALFRHEFALASRVDAAATAPPLELFDTTERMAMVFDDVGATALADTLTDEPLPLPEFYPLAIRVARHLSRIHESGIIHKDLNPSNIIVTPSRTDARIIDFSIASALSREEQRSAGARGLEGTLAYISPEQTGRMNRLVDWRSDLYSLGVVYYRLLTGRVPFVSDDPLELLHCHIALLPTAPYFVAPGVPLALSQIVMQLLAKAAEERYQSALGVVADLEACAAQSDSAQSDSAASTAPFALGAEDRHDRFQIPQKLYGRAGDIEVLLTAFDRVAEGTTELVLIQGYSGVGKSAVVAEIQKPVLRSRGYFAAGKLDQLGRNIPFAALILAMQELVRQLLAEREDQLSAWRERFDLALGANGQLIIDVIPEMALIVGPQEPVPSLAAGLALNRFNVVFQRFIRVFATAEHPLVLFLDDLQWADVATLDLLQVLITDPESRWLLVIGAYRDNEVDAAHPLRAALDRLAASGQRTTAIALGPLQDDDVAELVRDTLRAGDEASELAALTAAKTAGNPFFVSEFLKTLHDERLVRYDHARRRWTWDLAAISALQVPDRVVDLMAAKLRRLPESSLVAVQIAACVGAEFDLGTVAGCTACTVGDAAAALWEPMATGLIFPIGDEYRSVLAATGTPRQDPRWEALRFRFAHDRVQQAAYGLLDPEARPAIHLRIGRLIAARGTDDSGFAVVDHLDRARALITDVTERRQLAVLNRLAAEKAMASTAFGPAQRYAESGIDLAGDAGWRQDRALMTAMRLLAAECAALTGGYDAMERHCEDVLAHEPSTLDRLEVQRIRVMSRMARNEMSEAVDDARAGLALLDIAVPARTSKVRVLRELLAVMARIGRRGVADLAAAPEMTDAHELAAMGLLTRAAQPAYYSRGDILPVILLRMVERVLKHGNNPLAPYAWLAYGHMQNVIFGDIVAATKYGNFALSLMERYVAPADRAKLLCVHANFIRHWTTSWRESTGPLVDAYAAGVDSGEFEYGATAAHLYCHLLLAIGADLEFADAEMTKYFGAIVRLGQVRSVNNAKLRHQVVLNLLGRSADPCVLRGEQYDYDVGLADVLAKQDMTAIAQHHFLSATLFYLFGRPEALREITAAEQHRTGLAGLVMDAQVDFLAALVHLDAASRGAPDGQRAHLRAARARRRRVARLNRFAPMNHSHRLWLIDAECARVNGDLRSALTAYDRAIVESRTNGFVQDEAIAAERAALCLAAAGNARAARGYAMEARAAYLRWNAHAKVAHIDAAFPDIASITRVMPRVDGTRHTDSSAAGELDLGTVLKAAQAIAGEIVLPRLLERLMAIAVENAGAERGFLLLNHGGQWRVASEVRFDESGQPVVRTHQLDSAGADPTMRLAESLVAYVARTRTPVVLRDASREGYYTRDPYVAASAPRSVLCAPLVAQGSLSGIMYLENNLATDAFTPERLGVLQMLSGQAGIAIENARLYGGLEQRVEERTQQLSERTDELAQLVGALKRSERAARVARETAMLAEQVAHEANQAKTTFLTSMSHELRTPINAIIGYSELLEEEATDAGATDSIADLRKIRSAARHLLGLINEVLDLSKIEAGRMELVAEPVNVRAILEETIAIAEPLVAKNANTLVLECPPEVGVIQTDGMRLRQVLFNLLSNASKFTDHGTITVSAARHRTGDGDNIEFRVRDTGIGMTPEQIGRLFQAFSQADATIAKKYGGTGIGLVVVRRLSQLMGGDVEVASTAGVGTTFIVTIAASLP